MQAPPRMGSSDGGCETAVGSYFARKESVRLARKSKIRLQFWSTVGVTVLSDMVGENCFTIVVLLFWSQTPPALSPGPLLEGPLLDPQ